MKFSLFVARRLSLASGGRRSSPAIRVSVAAVALSIAVMIAAVAVVLGFKREIRDKIIGFNSHITLYAAPGGYADDNNLFTLTPSLKTLLDDQPHIESYSLEASIPAVFKTPSDFKGIYLKSLSGSAATQFIKANLEEGSIPDFSTDANNDKIVISRTAARQLGLNVGDKIDTYFISDQVRVRRLQITGIYNSHFDVYDNVMAYGSLSLIQKIVEIPSTQGTSLQIQTDNFDAVDDYTLQLVDALNRATADGLLYRAYRVENARMQGAGYFHWLSLLDTNVAVILTLMTIVAVATLISGMLILILDKKRVIGVTRAMGASVRQVRRIFVWLALRVAVIGMLAGNVLILIFLWAQNRWHFLPLDPEAYYIDFVPVQLEWWWILLLNVVSLIVIFLCLLVPSRFVAGISPTAAMRTE